jgi:hypothetical protein
MEVGIQNLNCEDMQILVEKVHAADESALNDEQYLEEFNYEPHPAATGVRFNIGTNNYVNEQDYEDDDAPDDAEERDEVDED